jgi:hypothetical protein
MSSVEEVFRQQLLADATMTSLIGTRLYPSPAPHATPTPFATYQRISSPEGVEISGQPDMAVVRIQFSFMDEVWLDARRVLDRCRLVSLGPTLKGTFNDVVIDSVYVSDTRDMGLDVDSSLYRHDLDLEIWQQLQG